MVTNLFEKWCQKIFLLSVKWVFRNIANYFKFIYYKKKHWKIAVSAVGKQYIVCALVRNALNCLYGNTTSKFCNVDPPNLKAYFAYISNFARCITRKGPLKINCLTYTQQAVFALPISVMTNLKILIQKGIFLYPTQSLSFPKPELGEGKGFCLTF